MRVVSVMLLLGALVSCDGGAPKAGGCDLSVDALDGSTWVMLETIPGKGDVENPLARARFYSEGGQKKLDYTVKSLGDVYTYDCAVRGDEIACQEKPQLRDFCMALEAHEAGSCTKDKLIAVGATGFTDEEYTTGIREAAAEAEKFRGGDSWQTFKLQNNNVGNKLQGLFYAKVDDKRCRLRVTDMFRTVYDGQVLEDSNPVGTNPFVKVEGEYLFEHCTDGRMLLDWEAAQPPAVADIPADRIHEVGKELHYFYYGETASKPEPGCTYSMDVWAQWRPVAKGVAVEPVDGRLWWSTTHTWTDAAALQIVSPTKPTGVLTLVRYKECGGKKDKIDVVCNGAYFVAP